MAGGGSAGTVPVEKTAIIICDMWDKHWCSGATERVNGLVEKMAPFLEAARKRGIQIIHAPSETMPFYQDAPQRKAHARALPKIDPPAPLSPARSAAAHRRQKRRVRHAGSVLQSLDARASRLAHRRRRT